MIDITSVVERISVSAISGRLTFQFVSGSDAQSSQDSVNKVYISPWKQKHDSGRTKAAIPIPFTAPLTLAEAISSFARYNVSISADSVRSVLLMYPNLSSL